MPQSSFFVTMILITIIWYFLLIRPQQQRAKAHRAMIEGLKKKDEVITQSGLYGTVVAVEENIVTIEIAKGVNVRIVKSFIQAVTSK